MARLERVTHKLFAENAPIVESGTTQVEIGQFGSALAGTYVATNDVETLQALPAYSRGWGGAVIPENNFPTLEDMNAVQRVQSYQTGYLYQEGIPEYDANTTYYQGSVCKIYQDGSTSIATSLINENIGNPLTDTASWAVSPLITENVLRYNRITNCLLEVPQRVKLELNSGVLTLKAGSKVIVPYGTTDRTGDFPVGSTFISDNFKVYDTQYAYGKFFVWAEVQSDIIATNATNNRNYLLDVNLTTNACFPAAASVVHSGADETGYTNRFYNTTTNIYKEMGADNEVLGFPVACGVFNTTNKYTGDYQVFNGIGFLGSTLWVDKGVKGLSPNGRNKDGSLKNVETSTTKITILSARLDNTGVVKIALFPNDTFATLMNGWSFYEQEEMPVDQRQYKKWYNPDENVWYSTSDTGATWVKEIFVIITDYYGDTTKVTSLQPKLPFRAVDYSDFVKVQNSAVNYPDYTKGISKSKDTQYTADTGGHLVVYAGMQNVLTVTINGNNITYGANPNTQGYVCSFTFLIKKGDTYKVSITNYINTIMFYPVR